MGDKSHRNINYSSVQHWIWKAVEFSCSVFYTNLCTNAVLPKRVKESCLCMMKFLYQTKLNYFYSGFWRLFFRHFKWFCFALICLTLFFLSKHTLLCTLYPRQEQEYSCGMTEILTLTRSARILKRNFSKIWSPSLPFQNVCMPWISL